MLIKISGGTYPKEKEAVAAEIVLALQAHGIRVSFDTSIFQEGEKHKPVLEALAGEDFPVDLEIF
jgi:hypothetical protein